MEISNLIIIMGIPTAVTGFCFWRLQKRLEKSETRTEEREKAREKNEVLLIRSVGAAIALGEATAIAIRNGKCNGDMERALEYAQKIKHEQKDFLNEQAVKNLY